MVENTLMPSASGAFTILANQLTSTFFPPLGPNLKVLLVWPKFPPSFWGFEGVLQMLPEAAMTPPLGLVTVGGAMSSDMVDAASGPRFR